MVKMDALVRADRGTFHILDYSEDMHPIGAQLVGSNIKYAGEAARIVEDLGFDVIDLNCGCPVDKVTKTGGGSSLLKNTALIGDILAEMVAAVKIPVTVKIRAGFDDDSIVADEITRIAEAAGATAIAIHARTREQAYKGPARWDFIRMAKEAAKKILVIGNGDLFEAGDCARMKEATNCDAFLVSRGTFGAPWICQDMLKHLAGEAVAEHSEAERKQVLLDHLDVALSYYSVKKSVIDMRRIGCWYMPSSAETREFRNGISRANTLEEVHALINTYF